jgi:hypothetical protein
MESIEASKNQIQKVEDIGGIYELKLSTNFNQFVLNYFVFSSNQ